MIKIISAAIFSLIIMSIIGCKLNEKTLKPEKQSSKIGVGLDVFADKKRTNIKASFENSSELDSIQIEFNGKKLLNSELNYGRIEFKADFENYEKTSQFLVTMSDGKQFKFELELKPIDFQVEEPFTVHRLKATEIKISGPYTGEFPLSLGIFDSYIGGFKTEAEFNKSKTAIIIPESQRNSMSVGNIGLTH